jgi:hypothetical protein
VSFHFQFRLFALFICSHFTTPISKRDLRPERKNDNSKAAQGIISARTCFPCVEVSLRCSLEHPRRRWQRGDEVDSDLLRMGTHCEIASYRDGSRSRVVLFEFCYCRRGKGATPDGSLPKEKVLFILRYG